MEEWKDIEEYEGLYQVSNEGRVRRMAYCKYGNTLDRVVVRYLKLGATGICKRYRQVSLCINNQRKRHPVHRLVARAFCEGKKDGFQVNHKDGNPSNNYSLNLEWCTPLHNTAHAVATGLRSDYKGNRNPFSKLTEEKVLEIRRLYAEGGHTYHSLASIYGCNFSTIGYIMQRKRWAHI